MHVRSTSRLAAFALLALAYVGVSHWLMTRTPGSQWDVVGVLGPMLAAIAIGAWRAGQRALGAIAAALVAALVGQALLGIRVPAQWLYVAQHAGVYLFLAIGFGATLRRGQVALITLLASRLHREMTPTLSLYTRHVTLAWTLFFVSIAAVSLLLFASVSFDHWALFANLLSPIAVAAMFGAEYLLRYRLHPEFERTSVADAIRSYRRGAKARTGEAHPGSAA